MSIPNWKFPTIEEGKPTIYNWVVQNKENLTLGAYTDIGAFTYINAKHGITIEEYVQIGSHCSLYSVSTIDNKKGPIILTTNKQFKKWPEIFCNDSTLTSAVLDRLLHHAETVVIEGKSYRMKDQIEE